MEQVPGSAAEFFSPGSSCGLNPTVDHWFTSTSPTMSVVDALGYGFGMFFVWSHKVGECGTAHYSVIDGYERIYRPSIDAYEYLFFVGDPMGPFVSADTDWWAEGVDNVGFSQEDFESTVSSVSIWNYDFYI